MSIRDVGGMERKTTKGKEYSFEKRDRKGVCECRGRGEKRGIGNVR